jgi:hypothetical protein
LAVVIRVSGKRLQLSVNSASHVVIERGAMNQPLTSSGSRKSDYTGWGLGQAQGW